MVHCCPNCPGSADQSNHLLQQLLHEDNDNDDDGGDDDENEREDVANFQQWTTVDRSQLVQQSLPIKEFVEVLVDKMHDLLGHSYIARSQLQYSKRCKEELADDEVIILVDFAENFKFIVQEKVESYHWNE